MAESMAQTFDGLHPCCLCKAITAAKQAEKKGEATAPVFRFEFPIHGETVDSAPAATYIQVTPVNAFADNLSFKPPLPPPRRACS